MSSKKQIDMCNGPLFKNIVMYTLPIIATSVLQLLFNTMDLLVVGRYCGSTSVGAVGSTSAIINLLVNLFMGLSVGVSVTVAQGLGGNHRTRVEKAVHTAMPVAAIGGLMLTVIGLTCSRTFLEWMGNPAQTIDLATVYMRIYFCGTLGSLVYNFGAAILRAAGDTLRPLLFLSAAGVLNVVLNVVFVRCFHMDVDGVALATVISQYLSAVLVVIALMRRTDLCQLKLKKITLDPVALGRILYIGLPAGIQSSLFSISNVIIQSSVNSFGAAAVTGCAAASNIEGYVYVCINSFSQTTMNFTGQNIGAGKDRRVHRIVGICLACVATVGISLGVLVCSFAKPLLSIYITDSSEAIGYGVTKLLCICLPYFMCGLMDVMTGTLRGMGNSISAMFISVLGICGFRLVWIFTVFRIPAFHTLTWLFLSYIISWSATFLVGLIVYFVLQRNRKKQKELVSV